MCGVSDGATRTGKMVIAGETSGAWAGLFQAVLCAPLVLVSLQLWLPPTASDGTVQGMPGAGLGMAVVAGGSTLEKKAGCVCAWPA